MNHGGSRRRSCCSTSVLVLARAVARLIHFQTRCIPDGLALVRAAARATCDARIGDERGREEMMREKRSDLESGGKGMRGENRRVDGMRGKERMGGEWR